MSLWRACARALLCVYENIVQVWTCVRARHIYLLFRNSRKLRVSPGLGI